MFTGLAAGTYKVRQMQRPGWKQTSPMNNYGLNVTITTGEHSIANDFFTRHGHGNRQDMRGHPPRVQSKTSRHGRRPPGRLEDLTDHV
jgi:hypothetical protein